MVLMQTTNVMQHVIDAEHGHTFNGRVMCVVFCIHMAHTRRYTIGDGSLM